MNGALINVDTAFKRSLNTECCGFQRKGASIQCFSQKCGSNYHLACAISEKCVFNQDSKTSKIFVKVTDEFYFRLYIAINNHLGFQVKVF
jgi:hypothetical protein